MTHVITGLGSGGAEAMLYKLVTATRSARLSHAVVALMDGALYGSRLARDGVPVTYLGMRQGVPDPRAVVKLVRLLRRQRPDVIQGWMYHADLLAGVAGAVAGRIPVIWGIHHSRLDPASTRRRSRWTVLACARLSGVLPRRIVCCADAALRSHAALGFHADRMVVIPNGFEVERFATSAHTRARIRRELALAEGSHVVGLVARFHPDKDFRSFLAAARLVADSDPDAAFVAAGQGADWSNPTLSGWIDELGLRPRIRLLGLRSDVPDVLAAMDVLASSSRSEGFPQVLGEAMLCGVPVAATDCGDSREIVGDTGRIVSVGDPAALAAAVLELLALAPGQRARLGAAARDRVRERYDIRAVARRYTALYAEVCGAGMR